MNRGSASSAGADQRVRIRTFQPAESETMNESDPALHRAWLVLDDGRPRVAATSNAHTPLRMSIQAGKISPALSQIASTAGFLILRSSEIA